MMTFWERRIAHIDRPVRPLEWRGARRQLLKAAIKKRRGLPSRDMSFDVMLALVNLKVSRRAGVMPKRELLENLEWRLLRERLLERKRAVREAARRRVGRSFAETKIDLWRRRRDWLRAVQAGPHA